MSSLCDFCKKEKSEAYYREVALPNGKTIDVFLCADCYYKNIEDSGFEGICESKDNDPADIDAIYNEIRCISDKLSEIIKIFKK